MPVKEWSQTITSVTLLCEPLRGSDCSHVERGAGGDSGGGDDEVQDQHRGSGEADAEEPGAAVLYDGVHDVLRAQASMCQCHVLVGVELWPVD